MRSFIRKIATWLMQKMLEHDVVEIEGGIKVIILDGCVLVGFAL